MWAVSQTEALSVEVNTLVKELNALSGERYADLAAATQRISGKIFSELLHERHFEDTSFVLPIERLSLENASEVGGKAANLGEVCNRANLPVPPGFAITAYGYQLFLDYNDLSDLIARKLKPLDINDTDALMAVSQEIQNRIMDADLPVDLESSILQAARDLRETVAADVKLAVRSSATSEDSEASFAGQHSTVLNVSEANLVEAYKEVVASTFSPRAIYYRRRRGYRDQDVNMSVAVIVMIPAKVSGVMYTVDPNDSRHSVIMISAVWGLAADAVEGSVATDFFQVDKRTLALESQTVAEKKRRLKVDAADGVSEESLPPEMQQAACLSAAELRLLAEYGLKLERHYGYALDIEWAIDANGRLYILQARPLKRSQRPSREPEDAASAPPGTPRRSPTRSCCGAARRPATGRRRAPPMSSSPTTCCTTSRRGSWWSPARPRRATYRSWAASAPSSPTWAASRATWPRSRASSASRPSWGPATGPPRSATAMRSPSTRPGASSTAAGWTRCSRRSRPSTR